VQFLQQWQVAFSSAIFQVLFNFFYFFYVFEPYSENPVQRRCQEMARMAGPKA
jgi:hypothetical protein